MDDLGAGKFAEKYLVPPLSVLDRRSGRWKERRKRWAFLPPDTDGRPDGITYGTSSMSLEFSRNGTSSFDPLLAELMIRWFCPLHGRVLDPFCGGVTRGTVAACMGCDYVGFDVRPEQVEANQQAWAETKPGRSVLGEYYVSRPRMPQWVVGDSSRAIAELEGQFDFAFTSPPYNDCEVYSDQQDDMSTMTKEAYDTHMERIIKAIWDKLNANRFMAFNVGNTRDKQTGEYRDLRGDIVRIGQRVGFKFWGDLVVVDPCAMKGVLCGKVFDNQRKVSHVHQYVVVMVKGNAKLAADNCLQN